jgi:hypothetical protein
MTRACQRQNPEFLPSTQNNPMAVSKSILSSCTVELHLLVLEWTLAEMDGLTEEWMSASHHLILIAYEITSPLENTKSCNVNLGYFWLTGLWKDVSCCVPSCTHDHGPFKDVVCHISLTFLFSASSLRRYPQ